MSRKKLDQWCRSVLPKDFNQVSARTSAIQIFLEEQLPEPINKQAQVVNCTETEIVIAAADPQIANYLRLYLAEIQQQIHETLDLKQRLVIKTMPQSMLQPGSTPQSKKPARVSKETAEAITKNASWVEDENLRRSLQSLAGVLKKPDSD